MKNRRKRTYSEGDHQTIGEIIGGLAVAAFLPCLIFTGFNVVTAIIGIVALIEICILIHDFWPVFSVMLKIAVFILIALLLIVAVLYVFDFILTL
ncbi:MAG: hypothetical protein IJ899_02760 [Blautia sp.]|nr:hypothetical protein [Blautia sp.]